MTTRAEARGGCKPKPAGFPELFQFKGLRSCRRQVGCKVDRKLAAEEQIVPAEMGPRPIGRGSTTYFPKKAHFRESKLL